MAVGRKKRLLDDISLVHLGVCVCVQNKLTLDTIYPRREPSTSMFATYVHDLAKLFWGYTMVYMGQFITNNNGNI